MKKLYVIGLIALAAVIIGLAWAEQMTFSTYYPAPYGVYREMRATRMAVGDAYIDGGTYSWEDGTIDPAADLIVEGNVGIGTAEPGATLEVKGTMKVFGGWESKSQDTVYQASTDGFVIATIICDPNRVYRLEGYTDSNDPPATKRAVATDSAVTNLDWRTPSSFTMPVRKGHYWEVTGTSVSYSGVYTVTIYWIPLGT